jgi:hypothetical protein
MFDNNGNIFLFNYQVQLDDIVKAICDIAFDIGEQIHEIIPTKNDSGFGIEDLFTEDFLKEISVRPEKLSDQDIGDGVTVKGFTKEEFFAIIAEFYNKDLFFLPEFLMALENSDILFIDKQQNNLLGIGDRAKDRLVPALKKAEILKHLVSKLKSEKIQNSLVKINTFESEIFYKKAVVANVQTPKPLLLSLPFEWINEESIEKLEVDTDDYWTNHDLYRKKNSELVAAEQYFLIRDINSKKELGLLIDTVFIPYPNIEFDEYIKEEYVFDYYWKVLKNTYGIRPTLITEARQEIVEEFIQLKEDVDLAHLLSYLKFNFYIDDDSIIKEKFKKFFNAVVTLDKLEFLEDYQFLMSSDIEEETALGVYTHEKKGSSYNLLHWLNHNGPEKVSHYRTPYPKDKAKKIIHTLKPSICYYYLEKYFEDFFEGILTKNGYDFLANFSFNEKGSKFCEIDSLVKGKNKLYYFETKTKLTKFYIDDFLKKSSKMIEKLGPILGKGIEVEFILLGGYSDVNVRDFQYFIESSENVPAGYNVMRNDLNTIPYYFNVPIPDKEGKTILCIAEPEFAKLETLVLELCQK